ncbi:MAG: flagellin FliC [Deltaproteobacteria bacterium]|nr:flagellin FliC [Deltaproteobacteria bacterium]
MSFRIGSTGVSLSAIRSLRGAESAIAQSSARLASGLRINRAADDAAGLAVSERFRAEIASLSRAQLNTQDGISLAQTAQGGLSEISSMLSEARALAVASSSGALGGQTRAQLDEQFQAILSDIDAIASTTTFSEFSPLDDDTLQVILAVGTQADDTITVSGVDATASGIGVDALDIATSAAAASSLGTIDTAISNVSALAARFGVAENRLESRSRLLGVQIEATSAADSRIRDADYAVESALLARNQIIQESAIAVIGQANANMGIVLRLLE